MDLLWFVIIPCLCVFFFLMGFSLTYNLGISGHNWLVGDWWAIWTHLDAVTRGADVQILAARMEESDAQATEERGRPWGKRKAGWCIMYYVCTYICHIFYTHTCIYICNANDHVSLFLGHKFLARLWESCNLIGPIGEGRVVKGCSIFHLDTDKVPQSLQMAVVWSASPRPCSIDSDFLLFSLF